MYAWLYKTSILLDLQQVYSIDPEEHQGRVVAIAAQFVRSLSLSTVHHSAHARCRTPARSIRHHDWQSVLAPALCTPCFAYYSWSDSRLAFIFSKQSLEQDIEVTTHNNKVFEFSNLNSTSTNPVALHIEHHQESGGLMADCRLYSV